MLGSAASMRLLREIKVRNAFARPRRARAPTNPFCPQRMKKVEAEGTGIAAAPLGDDIMSWQAVRP